MRFWVYVDKVALEILLDELKSNLVFWFEHPVLQNFKQNGQLYFHGGSGEAFVDEDYKVEHVVEGVDADCDIL